MKHLKIFLLYFFFITSFSYGQEKVLSSDLYTEKGLTYKKSDKTLFTGVSQFIKKKQNHVVFEQHYNAGHKVKYIEYYNTEEVVKCEEIDYYPTTGNKKKQSRYPLSGSFTKHTYFDESGKKLLIEKYENNKLIYSCEYKNNKKDGKEMCLKNEEACIIYFTNGKKQ